MSETQTKFERLELKYLIDESAVREIRSEVLPFCTPDPYNSPAYGGGYPISSLYLDTPTLGFHRAKLRGDPDRLKLRVRTYSKDSPAHLEVKRKCRQVVEKTRVTVARSDSEEATHGLARPLNDTPKQREYLEKFAFMKLRTGAEPTLLVRYEREAYVSTVDRYARVTFDRKVVAQRVSSWDLEGDEGSWCSLAGEWLRSGHHAPVLLELKCETRMPRWMQDLIRRCELRVQGFSKYCQGIIVTGHYGLGFDAAPGPRGAFV